MDPTDRIAALERRVRALAFGWAASVAVLLVGWAVVPGARPETSTLQARRIALVDEAGHERLVLGMDTKKRPGLWLYDDAGRARASIGFGLEAGTPQVVLSDPAGHPRVYLGFGEPRETPQLDLLDESRAQRIYVGWGLHSGKPLLLIADRSKKGVWSVP